MKKTFLICAASVLVICVMFVLGAFDFLFAETPELSASHEMSDLTVTAQSPSESVATQPPSESTTAQSPSETVPTQSPSESIAALPPSESGERSLLSNFNPDFYAEYTLDQDTIYIKGKFADYRILQIVLYDSNISASFTQADDGSFTAQLTSAGRSEDHLTIALEGAKSLQFRINYDKENGRRFPQNGINTVNAAVFEHITTASAEAVKLYLCAEESNDAVRETLEQIRALSDETCKDAETPYEKALELYRWVIDNIYYDFDARNSDVTEDTIAVKNVLERRRTVCGGFANTYAALLAAQGINAVNIKGSSVAGEVTYETLPHGVENHEWVAFVLDGRWIFADPAWGTSSSYENGKYKEGIQGLMYFDITNDALAFNHRCARAQERDYFGCLDSAE